MTTSCRGCNHAHTISCSIRNHWPIKRPLPRWETLLKWNEKLIYLNANITFPTYVLSLMENVQLSSIVFRHLNKYIMQMTLLFIWELFSNKKVLLLDRKRRTVRSVVSSPVSVEGRREGGGSGQDPGVPPSPARGLIRGLPSPSLPPLLLGGQTNKVKTLPFRRTTYAGSKNFGGR